MSSKEQNSFVYSGTRFGNLLPGTERMGLDPPVFPGEGDLLALTAKVGRSADSWVEQKLQGWIWTPFDFRA